MQENFVNEEKRFEDTMPIIETPLELCPKTKRSAQLRKKRGKFKMKKIKKIKKIFIIVFFMMIAIFPMKAKAENLIVPIAVNKEYNYKSLEQYGYSPNGGLQSFRLQFTLQESGRVRFYIKNLDKPEEIGMNVYWLSNSTKRICLKPYTEYVDSLYISLDAGEYSFELPSRLTANNNTVLVVQFEATSSNDFIEREPNSSFDTANFIALNQKYEGDVLEVRSPREGYRDKDYYKIQLDEGGKISVTTRNDVTYKYGAEGFFIIFSEDEYGNIAEIAKQSIDTTDTERESMHLRLPKGIYYFSVQGNHISGSTDIYENNINYSFKINYTAESSEAYEEEFNDYSSQANQKEINQSYIGNISNAEDKDCFRFKITQLSICSMVLNIPRQTSWDTFRAELYEDTMNNPAIQTISNDSNPHLESETLILQPGTYYVRLKSGEGYVPDKSDKIDYSFIFQQEPYFELNEINIPFSKTMKKGDSFQFEAEYIPENATQDVEWKTSDSSIVKIDDEGLAYAVSEGTAIITATSRTYKDIFAECEVIVTDDIGQPVEYTITFEPNGGNAVASKRVVKGSVFGELPVLKREGYIFKGWYTSSNGGTKITSSRKVMGNVTIYAQWTKEEQSQSTQKISLSKKSSSVVVGKTVRLQLKGATGKIAWKTSNKEIASVSGEGIVKTKRIGNVTVTATYGGKKYSCKITVKPQFKKVRLYCLSNGGHYFRVHSVKERQMTVTIYMPNMTRKKMKAVIKADGKTATAKFKCKNGRIHKLTMKVSANGNKVKVIETAMCRKKLLSWMEVDKKKKISQTYYPASHFRWTRN